MMGEVFGKPEGASHSAGCKHTSLVAFYPFAFSQANRSYHSRSNSSHHSTGKEASDLEDHSLDRKADRSQDRNPHAEPL
jgi:hypothetical protein